VQPNGSIMSEEVLQQLAQDLKSRGTIDIRDLEDHTHPAKILTVEVTPKGIEVTFNLNPPQDHSNAYRTVIKMLELHLEAGAETIELKAADVQQYVLNDWGWMDNFLASNAAYSGKARTLTHDKGL
jgi:hypothetical protein